MKKQRDREHNKLSSVTKVYKEPLLFGSKALASFTMQLCSSSWDIVDFPLEVRLQVVEDYSLQK